MQVGDHVRLKASGFTGTIVSTAEHGGENFYHVRYDPPSARIVTGAVDREITFAVGRKSLELIP